jgi:O-acetyl-ADP-ribose deacetylase (regulator of RNase III)
MSSRALGSEELTELASHLRRQNFSVGSAQVLSAQRLLWRMAQEGIAKPAAELAPWLAPVFATNARDLERFAVLYKEWQAVTPPPPPPPANKRRFLALSLIAGSLAIALIVGWWFYGRRVQPVLPAGNAVTGPPSLPDSRPQPAAAGIVTTTGVLRGDDGKLVAGAMFLYDGMNSLLSGDDGSFTISGRVSTPVLAVHCDYDAVLFPLADRTGLQLQMVHKIKAGCTDQFTRFTKVVDPRPRYQRIRLAISALPLATFLLWGIYAYWRRIGLQKWRGAASSTFAQIPVDDSTSALFPETEIQRSVQELRRPRPIPLEEIWVEPTVLATVENTGWFTPVFRARRNTPEYLVLIDRAGKRDHQARFASELIDRLKARGVYTHVLHYDSDPRTCTDPETGRPTALTDLSARFGGSQLWLVADSGDFFSAFTGRAKHWVDLLQQWPIRVLLTTAVASDWGEREIRLADLGFEIVPATLRGLARISEPLATRDVTLDSYPLSLETSPTRWVSNQSPSKREIVRLATELRLYLGRDGFRWLSACAEYPVIEWPLTLYLGKALVPPAIFDAVLRKLIRLPWFRRGQMPGWLREALIRKDKTLRKQVHGLLADRLALLASSPVAPEKLGAVAVAIEHDHKRRVEEDEVWLSLLWGREPGGPPLRGARILRLLFHKGRVWMGPRLIAMLAAAAILSGATWGGLGYGVPAYRPPDPLIEPVALDVAISQYHNAAYYKAARSSDVPFSTWCYQITQLILRRSIALVPIAPGLQSPPGGVSRRGADTGIVAGDGWSLVYLADRVVARKDYSPFNIGEFFNAPLPELPPAPGLTGSTPTPPPIVSSRREERKQTRAVSKTVPAQAPIALPASPPKSLTVLSGNKQFGTIATVFPNPLTVQVKSLQGTLSGVGVTFASPNSGPSAVFSPSATVVTNAQGIATVTASANNVEGDYTVTATVEGAIPAEFALTNVVGLVAPPTISARVDPVPNVTRVSAVSLDGRVTIEGVNLDIVTNVTSPKLKISGLQKTADGKSLSFHVERIGEPPPGPIEPLMLSTDTTQIFVPFAFSDNRSSPPAPSQTGAQQFVPDRIVTAGIGFGGWTVTSANRRTAQQMTATSPNGRKVTLLVGDISSLTADVIVNSSNALLRNGGSGVDDAIHRAAGPSYQKALDAISLKGMTQVGQAVMTGPGQLSSRGVKRICTVVGPQFKESGPAAPSLLLASYKSCLEQADQLGLRTIAFPAISEGANGYPPSQAAPIALSELLTYMGGASSLEQATMVLTSATFDVHSRALQSLLAPAAAQ